MFPDALGAGDALRESLGELSDGLDTWPTLGPMCAEPLVQIPLLLLPLPEKLLSPAVQLELPPAILPVRTVAFSPPLEGVRDDV